MSYRREAPNPARVGLAVVITLGVCISHGIGGPVLVGSCCAQSPSIAGSGDGPQFVFQADAEPAAFDPSTGLGAACVELFILEVPDGDGDLHGFEGFSFSLGHDDDLLQVVEATPAPLLLGLSGGSGPDFFAPGYCEEGVTVGVVFSYAGEISLVAEGPQHVVTAYYETETEGLAGETTTIPTLFTWEDGLGEIPVDNLVVVDGSPSSPDLADAAGELVPVPPITDLTAEVAGSGDTVLLAWTLGGVYDAVEVTHGAEVVLLPGQSAQHEDGPLPPSVAVYTVRPVVAGAVGGGEAVAVVVVPPLADFTCAAADGEVSLTWGTPADGYENLRIDRDGVPLLLLSGDATSFIDITPGVGAHEYALVGMVAASAGPAAVCSVLLEDSTAFLRGDANGDAIIDLGDAVTILSYLFDEAAAGCLDACDVNDDGAVDIADGISTLSFLFDGGGPPATPFPSCAADPSVDDLICASAGQCP